MGENTKIGWTDHTVNFWTGCIKSSPGCKFCYMYRDKERYGEEPNNVVKVNSKTINKVLRQAKPGDKIFALSWSDFFLKEADQWREEAWDIIRAHPQFIWQILTKHPDRILDHLPADWGNGWPNVWLGVSVENEGCADWRIPLLLKVPAAIHWLSCEPLLEQVIFDYRWLKEWCNEHDIKSGGCSHDQHTDRSTFSKIDWVVVGGESGNDSGKYTYRECQEEWIVSIIDQCKEQGVPVFVKQLGTHLYKTMKLHTRHAPVPEEWPEHLRVQQFPNT